MDDMSIVPRLAFESRLTLEFVAWLGYAKVMRNKGVHSAGMCTKHYIVNLNKLTTLNKIKLPYSFKCNKSNISLTQKYQL